MKKELIPIDTSSIVGTLGYGYTDKDEFKKHYEKITGVKLSQEDFDDLFVAPVLKYKIDGEDHYDWSGRDCPCCGAKNKGVESILDLH